MAVRRSFSTHLAAQKLLISARSNQKHLLLPTVSNEALRGVYLAVSVVQQLLLLLCGDIELNPGPGEARYKSTDILHSIKYFCFSVSFHIVSSSLPKLHELDRLEGNGKTVSILKDGANKWEDIATRLYFNGSMISQIRNDSQNNMQGACRNVFIKWLEGENGLREPRTWDTVIEVLKEAGLGQLAKDVEIKTNKNLLVNDHEQYSLSQLQVSYGHAIINVHILFLF